MSASQPDQFHSKLDASLRVAHVLCVDVVRFTLLSLADQAEVRTFLTEALIDLPTQGALLIDTGDGFAAVFENDPTGPLRCSRMLKSRVASSRFQIRMGIHSGPIVSQTGITGQPNATGPGINLAQRVMSLADPGMILMTAVAADLIRQLEPNVSLTEFGDAVVKHGKSLRVFALNHGEGVAETRPTQMAAGTKKVRSNLPALERDLAGRQSELDLAKKLLSEDHRRLLTLTGPGGIGKSTLAIEVGRIVEPTYADGVWLVECEDLVNPDQLVPLICSTLGSGATNLADLVEFLKDRQLLLILDCLERIASCGPLLDGLLRDARELQILATSRILLSCRRETELVLGPMDTESRGGEPSDAVKLFAEAASQAIPDFRVSSRNRKLVDRIVAATEGVPIHIVLATGKLRYMSLQELADRLDQNRLDTLKRKPVGADRHFSSIAVVEDSVKLLGKEELELLFGLSVFKGGFFLVDAASVLSSFEDVEGGVDELRNNSLLNGIAVHGRTRFRSLDLVSEYVERQVDPQWIAPMARMHADYFSSRSKQVRAEFEVGAWHQVQAVFWSDLANYRQAIQYALKNRDQALICEFGRYLARIFMESGLLSDFRDLAEAAERSAREQDDHVLLIEILGLTGGVKRREQNLPAAIQIWTERIELCLQEGELEQAAEGWLDLIDVAHSNKDFVRFKEYLDAFQSLVPQLKNEVILAQGLSLRALYLAEMGSGGESVELLRRAQALLEHLPSEGPEFYMWQSIAGVYGLLGEPLRSIDVCRKWLPRTLAAKQRSSSGLFLLRLHDALLQSKRYESAAKALALALAIPKSISVRLRELANEKSVEFEERHGIATPPEPQNETAWNAAVRDLMQQITAFEKEPL